jgi:signal transduction histidine kinase
MSARGGTDPAAARGDRERIVGGRSVVGHSRPKGWRSIRVRILVPVLVAIVGVLALGIAQTSDALSVAASADRASELARASGQIVALAHDVGQELVLTNDALRSHKSISVVDEAKQRTDDAESHVEDAIATIRTSAPGLTGLCDEVERALQSLGFARTEAPSREDGSAEVLAYYDEIQRSLLGLADAIPSQMSDAHLIDLSRSLALVGGIDRLSSLELDSVTRALTARSLNPTGARQLAGWVGQESSLADALTNLSPAAALYGPKMSSPEIGVATSIRSSVLEAQEDASAVSDPKTFYDAQSVKVAQLASLRADLTTILINDADALGTASRNRVLFVAAVTGLTVAVTLVTATVLAVRTSRRLRRTRYAALTAARIELPTAISNVIAARDAAMVRSALGASSSRIDAMLGAGPDEIGELASAFGAVHRQALRLAADQALLRMEVQAMFVALSRRGQTLVQRQIHLIDEFGREEADPDALARLFALDHLAARMRRNEENLLVLAGGEPGRWITRPVAAVDLIRAAAQEIEEYRRVEVLQAPDVAISAHVAGDVIHLMAELLENATSFSPPSAPVKVSARRGVDGLTISIVDSGIGMPDINLSEANERLSRPSALTSTLVGTMGLLVVARLAERHRIQVRLSSVAAGGTTASVTLPDRVLGPIGRDMLEPAPWMRDPVRARELPVAQASATSLPPSLQVEGSAPSEDQPSPPPGVPQPLMPMPGERMPVEVTSAGLPRRPGSDIPEAESSGWLPTSTPDPDLVRARLSSLASGIAAANHNQPAPPPAVARPR